MSIYKQIVFYSAVNQNLFVHSIFPSHLLYYISVSCLQHLWVIYQKRRHMALLKAHSLATRGPHIFFYAHFKMADTYHNRLVTNKITLCLV